MIISKNDVYECQNLISVSVSINSLPPLKTGENAHIYIEKLLIYNARNLNIISSVDRRRRILNFLEMNTLIGSSLGDDV